MENNLTFENEALSFGDTTLSFENDKLSFENDKLPDFDEAPVKEEPIKEELIEEDDDVTAEQKWLSADEAEKVVAWLKQVISYNLRNDITSFAKQTLKAVNTCSISYNQLSEDLEKIKNTFNSVAKRRGR